MSSKKKEAKKRSRNNSDEEELPEKEWEVEEVVNERTRKGVKEYCIRWVGWPDLTWEPETNVEHCQGAIAKFHAKTASAKKQKPESPQKQAAAAAAAPVSTGKRKLAIPVQEAVEQKEESAPETARRSAFKGAVCNVSAVIGKRKVNGHLQYLIEWEDADGFGGERTWESASACSCPNAVKAFETGGGKKANSSASKGSRPPPLVVGARGGSITGEPIIRCRFPDEDQDVELSHADMTAKYPQQLIDFYAKHVRFVKH